jgi:hypothetical protein
MEVYMRRGRVVVAATPELTEKEVDADMDDALETTTTSFSLSSRRKNE